jgi:AcrR family transcriptional regulator
VTRSRTGPTTRSALLRAAVEAVVDLGWQGASVREIAGRAGVPVGGIHYHFGGRDALLLEATMAQVAGMFATPAAGIAAARTVDELLGEVLGWAHTADATPGQRTLLLEVMLASRREPAVTTALDAALAGYREAVTAALARVGVDPAPGLVAALVAQTDGLWLHELVEPGFPSAQASAASIAIWRQRCLDAATPHRRTKGLPPPDA